MKPLTKILLGIATVWPFCYMIFFFLFMVSSFFLARAGGDSAIEPSFLLIVPLHFLTMLVITALTVFYIVNVFRNERVDKDKKVLWTIVLLMGSMIAMPIYWYLYIWSDSPAAANPKPQLGSADTFNWTNTARESKRPEEYVPPREPPNWRD